MIIPQQLLEPKKEELHIAMPPKNNGVDFCQQQPQLLPQLLLLPNPSQQKMRIRMIRIMMLQQLLEPKKLLHIREDLLKSGFNTWYAVRI